MKTVFQDFILKTVKLRQVAETIYMWPNTSPVWQQRYLSYSVASQLWQIWCSFCRDVILNSCQGGTTRSGIRIVARPNDNSWERVGYEAKEYAKGNTPHTTRTLRFRSQEPTWGDQAFLLRSMTGLSPVNLTTLQTGFGLSLSGPRHLQIVRNACAHTDSETMLQVRRIAINYNGVNLQNPIDIIWWLDSTTKTDAFFQWIEDMEVIAGIVTN